jgi:Helix-turn-helix domain
VADAFRTDALSPEPLRKGTRVTGPDRARMATDLKNRYDAGESIRALALATGRSYGFIHRILTEQGVALRSRGGSTRPARAAVRPGSP